MNDKRSIISKSKAKKGARNDNSTEGRNVSMVLVMSNLVHKRNGQAVRTDKNS